MRAPKLYQTGEKIVGKKQKSEIVYKKMVNISTALKIRFLKSYEGAARLSNYRKAAKHIEKNQTDIRNPINEKKSKGGFAM